MFDFWKLEDDKPYRDAMDEKIRDFAAKGAKKMLCWSLKTSMSAFCDRSTSSADPCGCARQKFCCQLDPGQCGGRWRSFHFLTATQNCERPHRPRSSERCDHKTGWQIRWPRWVRQNA